MKAPMNPGKQSIHSYDIDSAKSQLNFGSEFQKKL